MKFLVFFAMLAAPLFAQEKDVINADRPGIADSAIVVDRGTLQLEAGIERDRSDEARQLRVPVLLRYGIGHGIELRAESDTFSRVRSESGSGGASSDEGLSPLALGLKWQLGKNDEGKVKDYGFIGELTLPSGSGAFRQDSATGSIIGAAEFELVEKLTANPNAGVATYHGRDGSSHAAPFAAVTLEYDLTERLSPGIELARVPPDEGEDEGSTIADVQLAWIATPDLQLDVEGGTSVSGAEKKYVTAGVSYGF